MSTTELTLTERETDWQMQGIDLGQEVMGRFDDATSRSERIMILYAGVCAAAGIPAKEKDNFQRLNQLIIGFCGPLAAYIEAHQDELLLCAPVLGDLRQ